METILEIGKNGLTEGLIGEIKRQLVLKKRIKVRIRKSALAGTDREEFAQKVAERAGSNLMQVRGYVVWLEKKGQPAAPRAQPTKKG